MFRWMRERRQRREKEARERRAQLRRKAGIGSYEPPLVSLLPGEPYRDGVADDFVLRLIAQEELSNIICESPASHTSHDSQSYDGGSSYDSQSYDSGSSYDSSSYDSGGSSGSDW